MSGLCSAPVFFQNSVLQNDSQIRIGGEEADHIIQSRRLKQGDEIILTDGSGLRARAKIQSIEKSQVSLVADILDVNRIPPPSVRFILAAAIPKGDRQSVLLNMSTQLGMDEYWPLKCDHSVVMYQAKMEERWRRLIASSCKQSRRYYFPVLGTEKRIGDMDIAGSPNRLVIVGDIHGRSVVEAREFLTEGIQEILMLVGPEGGFSAREMNLLEQKNVVKLNLGNQVLRTETAAVSLLAALNQIVKF